MLIQNQRAGHIVSLINKEKLIHFIVRDLFTHLIHQQFPTFHPEFLFLDPNSDKNP